MSQGMLNRILVKKKKRKRKKNNIKFAKSSREDARIKYVHEFIVYIEYMNILECIEHRIFIHILPPLFLSILCAYCRCCRHRKKNFNVAHSV